MAATYPPGPAPMTTRSYLSAVVVTGLERQRDRLFEDGDDRLQQLRAQRAVDDPVVAGEGDRHDLADDDLPFLDDGDLADVAHGEDGALGRIDDRRELPDPHHAQVRDREGRGRGL